MFDLRTKRYKSINSDTEACPRLEHLFLKIAKRYPNSNFISYFKDSKTKVNFSYKEIANAAAHAKKDLQEAGVSSGQLVMLVCENRPAWLIAELAILSLGAIAVPAYTTYSKRDFSYILAQTALRHVFITGGKVREIFDEAASGIERIKIVDPSKYEDPAYTKAPIGNHAHSLSLVGFEDDDREKTALIIYTSGTSGVPKGIILSHRAINENSKAAALELAGSWLGKTPRHRFFSFLPLSHAFEHVAGLWFPIVIGAEIYYPQSIESLLRDITRAKATAITAVPRFFETIRSRLLIDIRSQAKTFRQKIIKTFYDSYLNKDKKVAITWKSKLAKYILNRLMKKRFGGRLQTFITGGAALMPAVEQLFEHLGILILTGYGMTETGPVVSVNMPEKRKLGSVGKPLTGVDVKIAKDGEILIRTKSIMTGIYAVDNSEMNFESWIASGDRGYLEDGYIFIIDRKKDIIVTSGGDNIAPQYIESILCLENEIDQALVYGDDRPWLSAIISCAPSISELSPEQKRLSIQTALNRANVSLKKFESVRKFIICEPFTIENSLLTPTFKLKRKAIIETFRPKLDQLYK